MKPKDDALMGVPVLRRLIAAAVALGTFIFSTLTPEPAYASPLYFVPLLASGQCASRALNAPFILPAGFTQGILASETSDPDFKRLPDMNQVNETGPNPGRFLYRTHELGENASVTVTDLITGDARVLAQRADWENLDGLKWTPWGTLLAAEEVSNAPLKDPSFPTAVHGLVYEIGPDTGSATARPALGSLSHEGIGIDAAGNLYVAEDHTYGSIFKFVPDSYGNLSSGQLYALKIVDEAAAPGDKTGTATWLPLDRTAVRIDAHQAAITAGATTYANPEDVEVIGDTLYVAISREHRVLAIGLTASQPLVTEFVRAGLNVPVEVDDPDVNGKSDEVTGFALPDNLAADRAGNLYIAEDNAPGDIWVATPDLSPRDGRADKVVLFASLTDCSAEPTGIYFSPDGQTLYVNICTLATTMTRPCL